MAGDYSTGRWRRFRESVLKDAKLRRLPCGRCKEPIDYDLPGNVPRGPQVDHKLPRSTHPHLFWRRDNVQPVHAQCNYAAKDAPHVDGWVRPAW